MTLSANNKIISTFNTNYLVVKCIHNPLKELSAHRGFLREIPALLSAPRGFLRANLHSTFRFMRIPYREASRYYPHYADHFVQVSAILSALCGFFRANLRDAFRTLRISSRRPPRNFPRLAQAWKSASYTFTRVFFIIILTI
jgi:hypothetical protein